MTDKPDAGEHTMTKKQAQWRTSRLDVASFDAETGLQVSYIYPPGDAQRIQVGGDDPVSAAALIVSRMNGLLNAVRDLVEVDDASVPLSGDEVRNRLAAANAAIAKAEMA